MFGFEEFEKEFRYQEASIKMSNPEFFGVTKKQAAKYNRLLAERDLCDYTEPDEEDIIDTDAVFEDINSKFVNSPEYKNMIDKLGNMPPIDQLPVMSDRKKYLLEKKTKREFRKNRLYSNL